MADFVDALNAHGLVVVLDLHSRKRIGVPEFGNLAMPDAESLAFWRSVAQEYADHPSVMFDAFNEPYSRYDAADRLVFDLTWECWRDGGCAAPAEDDRSATTGRTTYAAQGMQAVVDAIRDAGAEQPVLLGGLDYANDLSRWLEFRPEDDQLVAAFHSYDFKECGTRACWDEVLAPLARTVPVLTSELGATDPLDGYVGRLPRVGRRPRGRRAVLGVGRPHRRPDVPGARPARKPHGVGPPRAVLAARRALRGLVRLAAPRLWPAGPDLLPGRGPSVPEVQQEPSYRRSAGSGRAGGRGGSRA